MIIKIHSNNKYLLDILYRNPNTDFGLYAKPLKNGVIIGNAINATNYDIVFQDTKYSYLPEDSNAIDFQSYCNPLVILNIGTEFFGHALKSKAEFMNADITWLNKKNAAVDTETCIITVPSFYIDSNWYRNNTFILERYFSGILVTHQVGKIFTLQITAPSVFEALNLLMLVSLMTHVTNEYGVFTYIDDAFAIKYARILTNIAQVPYFVFYLYIKRTVRSEKQFEIVKPIFEKYLAEQGLDTTLTFYGTHQERIKFITHQLEKEISIVDIGCGEFLYYKKMMQNNFSKHYFAIDIDTELHAIGKAIASRYDNNNLQIFKNIADCKTNELVNIIITEVIEHNTPKDATTIVQQALQYNFNKIIITTPNVSFNKYYGLDAQSRHADHHFEWTEKEFEYFINNCVQQQYNVAIQYLGDTINNTQPTQVAIITKK
jgi:hypothetical protein